MNIKEEFRIGISKVNRKEDHLEISVIRERITFSNEGRNQNNSIEVIKCCNLADVVVTMAIISNELKNSPNAIAFWNHEDATSEVCVAVFKMVHQKAPWQNDWLRLLDNAETKSIGSFEAEFLKECSKVYKRINLKGAINEAINK